MNWCVHFSIRTICHILFRPACKNKLHIPFQFVAILKSAAIRKKIINCFELLLPENQDRRVRSRDLVHFCPLINSVSGKALDQNNWIGEHVQHI